MKILIVSISYGLYRRNLAGAMRDAGNQVDVFCYDASQLQSCPHTFDNAFGIDWSGKPLAIRNLFTNLFKLNFWRSLLALVYRALWPKYDVIFAISEPNLWCMLASWWFHRVQRIPLVYNPYDVTSFLRPQHKIGKAEYRAERWLFRNANTLIHKIGEHQTHLFDRVSPQTPKRIVQFFPYIHRDLIPPLFSNTHKLRSTPQIVYIGGIASPENPRLNPNFTHDKQAIIAAQACCELHVYPSPFGSRAQKGWEDLRLMAQKTPELKIHQGRTPTRGFLQELNEYDFGSFISVVDTEHWPIEDPMTVFGSKVFMLIAAELPIITCRHLQLVASFVEQNQIGIVLESITAEELHNKIKSCDYHGMKRNLRELKPQVAIEDHIATVTQALKELVDSR